MSTAKKELTQAERDARKAKRKANRKAKKAGKAKAAQKPANKQKKGGKKGAYQAALNSFKGARTPGIRHKKLGKNFQVSHFLENLGAAITGPKNIVTPYKILEVPLNPMNSVFRLLSQEARLWEKFRFRDVKLRFKESSPQTRIGALFGYTEYDSIDTELNNMQDMLNNRSHCYGPFYKGLVLDATPKFDDQTWYLTQTGISTNSAEVRQEIQAIMRMFVAGSADEEGTWIGVWEIEGTIEWSAPREPVADTALFKCQPAVVAMPAGVLQGLSCYDIADPGAGSLAYQHAPDVNTLPVNGRLQNSFHVLAVPGPSEQGVANQYWNIAVFGTLIIKADNAGGTASFRIRIAQQAADETITYGTLQILAVPRDNTFHSFTLDATAGIAKGPSYIWLSLYNDSVADQSIDTTDSHIWCSVHGNTDYEVNTAPSKWYSKVPTVFPLPSGYDAAAAALADPTAYQAVIFTDDPSKPVKDFNEALLEEWTKKFRATIANSLTIDGGKSKKSQRVVSKLLSEKDISESDDDFKEDFDAIKREMPGFFSRNVEKKGKSSSSRSTPRK